MGRLLDRLRRLLQQNAIRVSAADLPAEWRPGSRIGVGDRLEIGERRFRVLAAGSEAEFGWLGLADDEKGTSEARVEDSPWMAKVDGADLVLRAGNADPIRIPLRELLIYPAGIRRAD